MHYIYYIGGIIDYHCSVPEHGVQIRVITGGEFKTSLGPGTVVLYLLHLDPQKKNEEHMWKPRVRVGPILVGLPVFSLAFLFWRSI